MNDLQEATQVSDDKSLEFSYSEVFKYRRSEYEVSFFRSGELGPSSGNPIHPLFADSDAEKLTTLQSTI